MGDCRRSVDPGGVDRVRAGAAGCATAGWRCATAGWRCATARCRRSATTANDKPAGIPEGHRAPAGAPGHAGVLGRAWRYVRALPRLQRPGRPDERLRERHEADEERGSRDDADGAGNQSVDPEGRAGEGHRSSRCRRLRDVPSRQGDSGGRTGLAGCAASTSWRRTWRPPGRRATCRPRELIPNSQRPTRNHSQFPTSNWEFRWKLEVESGWALDFGSWELDADHVGQFFHGRRTLPQSGILFGRQLDLDDLLDPTRAQLHRDADEQIAYPVLTLKEHRARQDLLLVLENRLAHFGRGLTRRVPGAGANQLGDLGAAVGRPLGDGVDPVLWQQLGQRDARHRRVTCQCYYSVAASTENERMHVLH